MQNKNSPDISHDNKSGKIKTKSIEQSSGGKSANNSPFVSKTWGSMKLMKVTSNLTPSFGSAMQTKLKSPKSNQDLLGAYVTIDPLANSDLSSCITSLIDPLQILEDSKISPESHFHLSEPNAAHMPPLKRTEDVEDNTSPDTIDNPRNPALPNSTRTITTSKLSTENITGSASATATSPPAPSNASPRIYRTRPRPVFYSPDLNQNQLNINLAQNASANFKPIKDTKSIMNSYKNIQKLALSCSKKLEDASKEISLLCDAIKKYEEENYSLDADLALCDKRLAHIMTQFTWMLKSFNFDGGASDIFKVYARYIQLFIEIHLQQTSTSANTVTQYSNQTTEENTAIETSSGIPAGHGTGTGNIAGPNLPCMTPHLTPRLSKTTSNTTQSRALADPRSEAGSPRTKRGTASIKDSSSQNSIPSFATFEDNIINQAGGFLQGKKEEDSSSKIKTFLIPRRNNSKPVLSTMEDIYAIRKAESVEHMEYIYDVINRFEEYYDRSLNNVRVCKSALESKRNLFIGDTVTYYDEQQNELDIDENVAFADNFEIEDSHSSTVDSQGTRPVTKYQDIVTEDMSKKASKWEEVMNVSDLVTIADDAMLMADNRKGRDFVSSKYSGLDINTRTLAQTKIQYMMLVKTHDHLNEVSELYVDDCGPDKFELQEASANGEKKENDTSEEDKKQNLVQYIVVRGTDFTNFKHILLDLQTKMDFDPTLGVNLHRGFRAGALELIEDAKPFLDKALPIKFVGHSLGAAVSQIVALYLKLQGFQLLGITGFGCPRITDAEGAAILEPQLTEMLRVGNYMDIVRTLPRGNYKHFGRSVILFDDGTAWYFNRPPLNEPVKFVSHSQSFRHHRTHFYYNLMEQVLAKAFAVPLSISSHEARQSKYWSLRSKFSRSALHESLSSSRDGNDMRPPKFKSTSSVDSSIVGKDGFDRATGKEIKSKISDSLDNPSTPNVKKGNRRSIKLKSLVQT